MESVKKNLINILLLILGGLFSSILLFFTQVILARELSPLQFGTFSAAIATITLIAPLSLFGLQHAWLKVYGEEGYSANRILKPSLKFIFFSASLSILLITLWAFLGPHSSQFKNILLGLIALVFNYIVIELVTARLQLESKFSFLSLWQLFPNLFRFTLVVFGVLFLFEKLEIIHILFVYNISAILMILASMFFLIPMVAGNIKLEGNFGDHSKKRASLHTLESFTDIFKLCSPFGLAAVFYLIYLQSDLIIIKYLKGDEAVGIYNAAFVVILAFYLIPGIIYQKFLLPKFHQWANHDESSFLKFYQAGNGIMLMAGIVLLFISYLVIPILHPLLFGMEYLESVKVLSILILCIPVRFLATSIEIPLFTRGFMNNKTKIMGLVAMINLVLNFLLIPIYSIYGAAISTLISEILLLILYSFSAMKNIFGVKMWQNWFLGLSYQFWKNHEEK